MGLDQPLIARAQGRITLQQGLRPALVVPRPVAHVAGLRSEQGQPAIQLLVQAGIRVHRQARRQAQVAGIAPGHRQLLAGAGHLLQQITPQQQLPRAGGFHADPAGAAHGAKQQRQRALHSGQFDPRFGEIRAGAAGDKAVPDTADPLFQFDGKGHGVALMVVHKQQRPAVVAGPHSG